MPKSCSLSQSAEDYLEAVHVLAGSGEPVRVTDVARHLKVSKPSVVAALDSLERKGFVRHERYGGVELTERGETIAREVYRRHRLLQEFLRDVLGVPDEVAARDACEMEHALSPETVERLLRLVDFVRRHEDDQPISLQQLARCLDEGTCGERPGKGSPGRTT